MCCTGGIRQAVAAFAPVSAMICCGCRMLAAFYARATGDWSLFGEPARFLRARPLEPGEDEALLAPEDSGEVASLYEHCCRALDRSLTQGAHGLPLMGTATGTTA
jgi:cellobiose phosphorylase